ncbi:MAG: OmpH family outer membrane protein [Bacteroidales bacterium]|nr:OmpH family outer membrane protein [Bacteroidales bacterium]
MKKSLIALLVVLFAFGTTTYAQKANKFGHINSADLMQIMPGKEEAQAAFQAEVEVHDTQLKAMQEELQKKYNDYMEKQSQMSDLIRSTKEQEIRELGSRIETYQQNAQELLQAKEKELLQPIIDRAKQAISDVAKENGYTYIFDSSTGTLLYQPESDDIMPLVKKKLGLN